MSHAPGRSSLPVIFLLFLGLCPTGLCAADYRDEGSGAVFPDNVGGLHRTGATRQESGAGQGLAVSYTSTDAEVAVYVRRVPAGSPLTSATALKQAMAGITELEKSGVFTHLAFHEFAEDQVPAGWRAVAYTAQKGKEFVASSIYCRVHRGFSYKLLASSGKPANEKSMANFVALLKAMDGAETRP